MMNCHLPRLALVAALCLAGAAHAADIGRVLLAADNTVAIRGNQTVKLFFGTAIQDKDVPRTGTPAVLGMTGIFMGPQSDHLGVAFHAKTTSGPTASAQTTKILSCALSC